MIEAFYPNLSIRLNNSTWPFTIFLLTAGKSSLLHVSLWEEWEMGRLLPWICAMLLYLLGHWGRAKADTLAHLSSFSFFFSETDTSSLQWYLWGFFPYFSSTGKKKKPCHVLGTKWVFYTHTNSSLESTQIYKLFVNLLTVGNAASNTQEPFWKIDLL